VNRSIFQNWKPNIFKNINAYKKAEFQYVISKPRYDLNFKSKTKLILFSKNDRYFFESYINLYVEKNKISDIVKDTLILYPMVTSDYLNEVIKIYKNFLELHNIQLIKQLDFLVKMEEDMSKSIKELQSFHKNSNITTIMKNKEICKIQGNALKNYNYIENKLEIVEVPFNKFTSKNCAKTENKTKIVKIKFNGFTLLSLIRKRYGAFLAFTIEADLIELIVDMVYSNIRNGNIDTYENLTRHLLITEETLKKVGTQFNNLNIHYNGKTYYNGKIFENGKTCVIDTKYMYLTYKVLFITVLVYELERNFTVM